MTWLMAEVHQFDSDETESEMVVVEQEGSHVRFVVGELAVMTVKRSNLLAALGAVDEAKREAA